jgi:hypothetical protein
MVWQMAGLQAGRPNTFDAYRVLFLRINVAMIHLVCSMSGASVPMTGLVTIVLVAAIKLFSRQLTVQDRKDIK